MKPSFVTKQNECGVCFFSTRYMKVLVRISLGSRSVSVLWTTVVLWMWHFLPISSSASVCRPVTVKLHAICEPAGSDQCYRSFKLWASYKWATLKDISDGSCEMCTHYTTFSFVLHCCTSVGMIDDMPYAVCQLPMHEKLFHLSVWSGLC